MLDLNQLPHTSYKFLNRAGVELFVRLNGTGERPTALVAHGLSDVHDSAHMRAITGGLVSAGYDVLTYDATNSWGRSGGAIDRATLSAAYQDLCDVYQWLEVQPWFDGSLIIAGHSLGGAVALKFAAANPKQIKRLILVSPVVNGKLMAQRLHPLIRTVWWFFGRLPELGIKGKWYSYNLLHDGRKYDGLALAKKLSMPTLIVAAANDALIPLVHQRLLKHAMLQGSTYLQVITGANHTFSCHIDELADTVTAFAKSGGNNDEPCIG